MNRDRIDPDKIFNLYQTIGYQYEEYLIAAVNVRREICRILYQESL